MQKTMEVGFSEKKVEVKDEIINKLYLFTLIG